MRSNNLLPYSADVRACPKVALKQLHAVVGLAVAQLGHKLCRLPVRDARVVQPCNVPRTMLSFRKVTRNLAAAEDRMLAMLFGTTPPATPCMIDELSVLRAVKETLVVTHCVIHADMMMWHMNVHTRPSGPL